jgi:molecular chaperone DnaK (HSP70)
MYQLNVNVLQVERMVQEAERNAEEDRRRREVIDLKNQVQLSKPTSQLLLQLTSKMGVKK